jgi:hypothetical protein
VRVALAVALVLTAVPARAAAPTKAECLAAYTDGQDARQVGKLQKARAQFALCAGDPCPRALHADCTRWHGDVDRLMPSIVLAARGADGRDRTEVRVLLDGAPVADRLDGRALEIDPGEHSLRFEAAGEDPVEQRIVIHEGEKTREIAVTIGAAPAPSAPVAPEQPLPSASRPVTWPTYVFGGVAVVSLAAFAYFGITGLSRWEQCTGGKCASSDKSYVDSRWTAADVTGGVALVSAAAAAYFFATRPAVTPQALPGGAGLAVHLAF